MQLHQTFTIEPILTLGAHWHRTLPDSWTAVTVDGSYTAQFEHTVMVTDNGIEVLTGTDKGQQ
jgi:methionyl aminopeptidase